LKKKLTFYVPAEEKPLAWRFLNENFRDEDGKPKYFDYLSVREGDGTVTVTIYKKRRQVEYILLKLHPKWHENMKAIRGLIHRRWREIRREYGHYGYP